MARLGDYIEQIRGVSYKPDDICNPSDSDAVAILRANNIQDDGLNFDDLVYVKKSKVSDKQYIQQGDIVVCASSGSKSLVGKAAIATENCSISFGAFCKVVRPKKLIPSYLGYFFQSPKYRSTISELSGGANINNIRNEHIDELDILIISEEKQESIANKLDALSNLISLRKQQLSKLDKLVKARFVEMFGDPVNNPMEWSTKQLQELVTDDCTISYGIVQTGDDQEDGVPVFRPVDIVNHIPLRSELKKTTEEISNKYKRTILKGREMLITVRANIADTYIVGAEFSGCNVGRGIVPIRTKEDEMVLEFLKYQIDSKHLNDNIKKLAKGITLIQLNMEDLREVTLIVPPIEKQKIFIEFAKQIDKSKFEVQQSLEKLETLKKSLMQQYFG